MTPSREKRASVVAVGTLIYVVFLFKTVEDLARTLQSWRQFPYLFLSLSETNTFRWVVQSTLVSDSLIYLTHSFSLSKQENTSANFTQTRKTNLLHTFFFFPLLFPLLFTKGKKTPNTSNQQQLLCIYHSDWLKACDSYGKQQFTDGQVQSTYLILSCICFIRSCNSWCQLIGYQAWSIFISFYPTSGLQKWFVYCPSCWIYI